MGAGLQIQRFSLLSQWESWQQASRHGSRDVAESPQCRSASSWKREREPLGIDSAL